MQLMMIDVPTRERGLEILDRIEDAVDLKRVSVEDMALVHRTDKGKVKIHQTREAGAGKSALRGGTLGLLVGIVAAPVAAAAAVGAGAGALVAKAHDRGIDNKMMKRVGEHIEGSEAAVFVLADDASVQYLASSTDMREQDIDYVVVSPEVQNFIKDVAGSDEQAAATPPSDSAASAPAPPERDS